MPVQPVCKQTYVQKHGYDFLRIGTDTDTELVHRPFLAIQHKTVRLALSQKLVCHEIICLRPVYPPDYIVKFLMAYLLAELQVKPVLQKFLLLGKHTDYVNSCNHDRILGKPDRRLLFRRIINPCRP